jgi:hypothetical protein
LKEGSCDFLAASLSGRTTYESTISTTAARSDFWAFAEPTSENLAERRPVRDVEETERADPPVKFEGIEIRPKKPIGDTTV